MTLIKLPQVGVTDQINVLSSKEKEDDKTIRLKFTSHRYELFPVLGFYLTYVVDNALNYSYPAFLELSDHKFVQI